MNVARTSLLAAAIISTLAAVAPARADSLDGDVAIASRGDRAFIGVDTARAGRQGLADYGFVFIADTPLPAVSEIFRHAHVEFEKEYVRVISAATHQIFSFHIAGTSNERRAWPEEFKVTRAEGHQLSWYDVTTKSITLAEVAAFTPARAGGRAWDVQTSVEYLDVGDPFSDPMSTGTAPTCKNGGKGSTQCSNEWEVSGGSVTYKRSCSTTCGSGYYACCNDYSCKCYKN